MSGKKYIEILAFANTNHMYSDSFSSIVSANLENNQQLKLTKVGLSDGIKVSGRLLVVFYQRHKLEGDICGLERYKIGEKEIYYDEENQFNSELADIDMIISDPKDVGFTAIFIPINNVKIPIPRIEIHLEVI